MDPSLPFLQGQNPFDIHVYFKPDEAPLAAALKDRLLARFDWLQNGRWSDSAGRLSPHPLPMFEVLGGETKNVAKVPEVIEWLEKHRGHLSVLIHPNTTDGNVHDHSVHAVWLGEPVAIRMWVFYLKYAKVLFMLATGAFIIHSSL